MSLTSLFERFGGRGNASRALIAIAIPLPGLALGGFHTPILCATATILACAAFAAWFDATPGRSRLPATILLFAGLGLTAFTALQAIPLPAGLVKAIAPANADVWSRAFTPLGEPGPSWITLSLDPLATRVQVVRGLTYIAAFLVALKIADTHGGTRFLSWVIVASALTVGLAAVLHPMFGMTRVFGLYSPTDAGIQARHIAPLLNPNHLSAYLNIGFCIALGMALSRRRERFRPIFAAMALLLAGMVLWIASRGGTLALLFGGTLTVLTTRVSRRFATGPSLAIMLPLLAVGVGVGMIVIGASQDASSELGETDVSKVRLALEGLKLVPQHALFGIGRGAFEASFPAVRLDPGYMVVTHPENVVVQWLTEWGLPATIAGGAAIAYALRPKVLLVSSSPALGAWAAIPTTLAHNLVDFNSEAPAIGVLLAVCAAMVVSGRGNPRAGPIHRWAAHPRLVAVGASLVTLGAVAIALVGWPHELDEDRHALFNAVTARNLDDSFAAMERDALARHPSEPYVPFMGSVDAARRGRSVVGWIERTLELAPVYPPAHFVLAQQLESTAPAQARLEYRLTIGEGGPGFPLAPLALKNAERLVGGFDDALELVPPDARTRLDVLTRLGSAIALRLPATRVRIDEMIAKLDRNAHDPLLRAAEASLEDLSLGDASPWCAERQQCVQAGLSAVERLAAMEPGTCEPAVLRARFYVANDDAPRALHDLQIAAQGAADPAICWRALGELAMEAKSNVFVTTAEDEMARMGCANDADCASNLMWVATLEERRGKARAAIRFYERAHDRAPDRTDIVEHIAVLTTRFGYHAKAREAYLQLQRMTGEAHWGEAAEKERAELFRESTSRKAGGDAGVPERPTGFSRSFENPFDDGSEDENGP